MPFEQIFQNILHTDEIPHIIEELSNKKNIKISNNLALASMDILEVSLNVFLALISEITREDNVLLTYDISLSDLKKKIKRKNIDREKLEEIRNDLMGNNIVLNGSQKSIPLCEKFEINTEENTLFIRINPDLKKELLNLSGKFTQIDFDHILSISGLYAKKFYMYIKARKGMKEWKENLESMHTIFNVSGVSSEYRSFKSRVILDGIEKIGKLEDNIIDIKFKEIKKNKKVKKLVFMVTSSVKKTSHKPFKKKKDEEGNAWKGFAEEDQEIDSASFLSNQINLLL